MAWGRSRARRRPRGDGTRGPRTSSARGRAKGASTSIYAFVTTDKSSSIFHLGAQACASVLVLAVIAMALGVGILDVCGAARDEEWLLQPLSNRSGPVCPTACWLGFEFDSTLGYPHEGERASTLPRRVLGRPLGVLAQILACARVPAPHPPSRMPKPGRNRPF